MRITNVGGWRHRKIREAAFLLPVHSLRTVCYTRHHGHSRASNMGWTRCSCYAISVGGATARRMLSWLGIAFGPGASCINAKKCYSMAPLVWWQCLGKNIGYLKIGMAVHELNVLIWIVDDFFD